jgi:hypothetical protein
MNRKYKPTPVVSPSIDLPNKLDGRDQCENCILLGISSPVDERLHRELTLELSGGEAVRLE